MNVKIKTSRIFKYYENEGYDIEYEKDNEIKMTKFSIKQGFGIGNFKKRALDSMYLTITSDGDVIDTPF